VKHLVLARLANPQSKRSTQEFLSRDFGVEVKLDQIYRALDSIDDKVINQIQKKTLSYTKDLFSEQINLVFYDCTTLYFESFTEDELKSFGYSKDNKFNQSQVLLALAVTQEGLPLGYELFAAIFMKAIH
jgi:transposase